MIKHDTRNMLYAKGFRMVEESPPFYLNKDGEEDEGNLRINGMFDISIV